MSATNTQTSPVDRALAIEKEVSGVASLYGIKSAESQFLRGLVERKQRSLSPAQEKWLSDIERRVFEGGD